MARHLRGEGMGRVDRPRRCARPQIGAQARRRRRSRRCARESAARAGCCVRPASDRIASISVAPREAARQRARLRRAAENQKPHPLAPQGPRPMTAPRRWLSIIGIGEDGLDGLSPAARRLIAQAALVVGGARHLALAGPIAAANPDLAFADRRRLARQFWRGAASRSACWRAAILSSTASERC